MGSLTKAQSELITFLFGASRSRITGSMMQWISASPRYTAFVSKYKDKIRKKLRNTKEREAIADLLVELRVPYLLLQDKRFDVAYEPYAAAGSRGPDLAVTFRSNLVFNMEVTHGRALGASDAVSGIDPRLIDTICGKLSQTVQNMPNVLLVVSSGDGTADLAAHVAWMKTRVESKDEKFYARYKFANASAFFKLFERLSALGLLTAGGQLALWQNPQARVKLPNEVLTALRRAFDPHLHRTFS